MKKQRCFLNASAFVLAALGAWVACSSGGGQQGMVPSASSEKSGSHRRHARPVANPSPTIKHVVIIIQENRSLNTIFGGPSPFPNATTSSFGYEHDGTRVNLSSVSLADSNPDVVLVEAFVA
jgi:phospholipase C